MYKIIIQNRTTDWTLINGQPERVTDPYRFTVLVKAPTHSGDERIIEVRHCDKLSEAYHLSNAFMVEYPNSTTQRIR
jgi:hypothetical protein